LIDKKIGNEYLQLADTDHQESWIPTYDKDGNIIEYYYKDGNKYDLYCTQVGNGLYRSVDKIYFKPLNSDKYQ
jgi:hypothetical protein